jgi:putative oxidoreductase
MDGFVTVFYDWSRAVANGFKWLAPLAVRIVVGSVFLQTGWMKLNALPRMIENFRDWGIPAPEILTPLTSGIEFVGGALLLVGLLTRFAAVPLMIVMVVAIFSAKWGEVDSFVTLMGFEEVSYFVMFAWLAIAGPGPVSLDHFLLRAAGRKPAEHGA